MPVHLRLPRSAPHEQGVSARRIAGFLDSVERDGPEVHSLMVLRHGVVVAEGWWDPYRADAVHQLFSQSKAFTSTAIGFARAEGLLTLDDLVLDHLRDLAPAEPDPNLARMRIRHLLTMTTGHEAGIHAELFDLDDWERAALALPVAHEPGTGFVYTSAATYLLSVVLRRLTGQRLLEYLRPRVLEPLGIEGMRCDVSPSGVDNGGFGMSATTEDLACLGLLYLDGGRWGGRQILPPGWAEEATSFQTPSHLGDVDWAQGYGYQFWRCRYGAVRADGAFGQFAVVMPEQDAVIAITSGTSDLQGVLDRVWEHLLPAVSVAADDGAGVETALVERLAGLRLEPPAPDRSVQAPALHGWTIAVEENPAGITAVTIGPDGLGGSGWAGGPFGLGGAGGPVGPGGSDRPGGPGGSSSVGLRFGDVAQTLRLGDGRWELGELASGGGTARVAAAGAWTAPDTYTAQVRWYERPSCLTIRAVVDGDRVRADARFNVRFRGPTDLGEVVGVAGLAG
jgi:CubicO group peptidase (beta-lactamase class C family)